ncbi:LamG domain-containing protein [Herbidospora daliensis]|uniref:LamG domain-containing protein n=1 Tax=Herbidospora daliensis TaxID=295585 RepID=UPI0007834D9F|nr:LamG domain-containing protein [Herbidospora daliensis]
MTANPLMHWPMDEVVGQSLYDASGNGRTGTASGTAKAVPDEQFGSALNFTTANQYVVGPGMNVRTYTFEVWVRTAKPAGASTPLLNRRNSVDVVVNLNADGSVEHRFVTQQSAGNAHTTPAGLVQWDTWQHIAVTNDGGTAQIYVDGELADEWDYPGTRDANDPNPLVLGGDIDTRVYTAGRYAHLRGYDGALTPAEIARDLAEDSSTLAAFVRAHPMDLELLNLDEQPVLFIDNDPSGQPMTLRLTNSSRQNIEFQNVGGVPSSGNNHVAIRFRPDVLSTPPKVGSGSPNWAATAAADGTAVYVVAKTAVAPLAPGNWIDIPLTGLSADPAGGSRGTRIEFDYQRMRYANQTDGLVGSRLQFLDVVNHRGRPDIPLAAGFANGNTVLNDGATPSTLILYVANTSTTNTITLPGGGPDKAGALFTVTFDIGANGNDWALAGSADGVAVAVATPGASSSWGQESHDLDTRASWTLYPAADLNLAPGKAITFTVSGIVGLGDPGRAGIVVGWENIPGYRDGSRTLEAERRPLAFSGSNAGVGTLAPAARLHVVDQTRLPTTNGSLVIGPPAAGSLKIGYGADHGWLQSGGTSVLALNPSGNRVIVGATGTNDVSPTAKLVSVADELQVQLRRTAASGGSGRKIFLELLQEDMDAEIYPTIRFHQSRKFWQQLQGRADGFHFVSGNDSTTPVDVYAATFNGTALKLGDASLTADQLRLLSQVTAAQLQVLARLAAGQLKVGLYNDTTRLTAAPSSIPTVGNSYTVIGLELPNVNQTRQQFRLTPVTS